MNNSDTSNSVGIHRRKNFWVRIMPTPVLTYLIDGVTLNMPLAARPPAGGYKKPHWAPAVLNFVAAHQEASATAEK
jgi:hypothetical protein